MNKNLISVLVALTMVGSMVAYNQYQQISLDQFESWKIKFSVTWTSEEDIFRRMIFFKNVQKINKHNSDPTQSYKMDINQFTPYTENQFRLFFLDPKPFNVQYQKIDLQMPPNVTPIDWTQKGFVSPIKNQGKCGSCYAFSAVATLQSYALMHNKSVILSEQQILDCSWAYENTGCNGGDNFESLKYVKDHGLSTLDAYPYIAKNQVCKVKTGDFKITGVNYAKGCTPLLTALESRPVGVSVDASNWAHYASGIFHNCNRTLDHDVLLVGASDTFWKIKNSWGQTWGEQGFIRLKSGDTCGICQDKSPWPV